MSFSKPKSIVLLSAGLDSSVNFYHALQVYDVLLTLTFDYSQKAARPEIECARKISQSQSVPHQVITLPWFSEFNLSSLISPQKKIPKSNEVKIDNLEQSQKTAKSVWVPNRNGIFLNIAAGFAENLGAQFIVPGFNHEEAVTFSDNSEDFMKALDQSFFFSTQNKVQVKCFTTSMNKTQILTSGLKLGLSLENIWPCYESGDRWCGVCESCQRSKRAFKENNIDTKKYFES